MLFRRFPDFRRFLRLFFSALWEVREVLWGIGVLTVLLAAINSSVEELGFWDSLYLLLITALTVGYGDLSPVTSLGKVIAVLAGVIGIVAMGLVVAAATWALNRTFAEKQRGEAGDKRRDGGGLYE